MGYWGELLASSLDLGSIAASAAAAWFWYRASAARLQRAAHGETFDYHDLNRVIVAINRNNLRNRNAALASAIAAAVLALDLLVARFLT